MKLQMMLWEERRWQVDGIYYSEDWGGGRWGEGEEEHNAEGEGG